MIKLNVEGMTCGHCVKQVTQAVHCIEPDALVDIDLESGSVVINSAKGDRAEFARVISEAGYPVTVAVGIEPSQKKGCCCA